MLYIYIEKNLSLENTIPKLVTERRKLTCHIMRVCLYQSITNNINEDLQTSSDLQEKKTKIKQKI